MITNSLANSILRGKWFIHLRDVELTAHIIQGILNHEHAEGILSDRVKLTAQIGCRASGLVRSDGFSEAPSGSKAIIPLHGDMTKYGSWCNYGTSEIAAMILEAADQENIDGIILDVDSGGGCIDAISPLVDAIEYAKKRKCVIAHCDLCASAAYYVGCFCDEMIASNDISSEFGSIGVMMSFPDYAKYYENAGVKIHTIYSSLSDYKNAPFEAAKKGEYDKIRQEELDPLARNFQDAVKKRRCNLDLKVDGILNGRTFYAHEALRNGMIDGIGDLDFVMKRFSDRAAQSDIENYLSSK